MSEPTKETIPALLVKSVPRSIVTGIEDSLIAGAQRAYAASRGMDEGHLSNVVGQLRHFHMNEAFQRALAANNGAPSAIRGNEIVTAVLEFLRSRGSTPEWDSGTMVDAAKRDERCRSQIVCLSRWYSRSYSGNMWQLLLQ